MATTRRLTVREIFTPDGSPVEGADVRATVVDDIVGLPTGFVVGKNEAKSDQAGAAALDLVPGVKYSIELVANGRSRKYAATMPDQDITLSELLEAEADRLVVPRFVPRGPRVATWTLPIAAKTGTYVGETTLTVEDDAPAGFRSFDTANWALVIPRVPPPGAGGLWFYTNNDGVPYDADNIAWGPTARSDVDRPRLRFAQDATIELEYNAADGSSPTPRIYLVGRGATLPANATVECYLSGIFRAA